MELDNIFRMNKVASKRAAALHVLLLGPIFNKLTPDTQNTVIAELTDQEN